VCSRSTPNTPKKTFERVIASGNHLLTQVKDNQPSLRRRLELGTAGRKPKWSDARINLRACTFGIIESRHYVAMECEPGTTAHSAGLRTVARRKTNASSI
jgi:hypothetical protein